MGGISGSLSSGLTGVVSHVSLVSSSIIMGEVVLLMFIPEHN